ncbi:hypothetical protein FPV67DRAFT_1506383 [Lyophyllum atratum]|nr:hypothetical protein FPV67DRAFT_1506383 [Lyophyllum atratum]
MSSTTDHNTTASRGMHPTASGLAAFMKAQMAIYFELHGVPEDSERHILMSDASNLVLEGLSDEAPASTSDEISPLENTEDSSIAVLAGDVLSAAISSDDSSDEAISPSESRRRSARIVSAHQAAVAVADDSATIVVTASATGEGVHTRWGYPDGPPTPELQSDPVEEALAETSAADSSSQDTLVGSSDDESVTTGAEKGAKVGAPAADSSQAKLVIIIPPSKKRVRVEDPSEEEGAYRRTRSRVPTPGPAPKPRSGVRFYTLPAGSSTPIPSSSSHRLPSRPFNHYPTPPRSRPQGLRREPAFYHKSHYEVGWVPEFGAYDRPPQTVAEATPEWVKDEPIPSFAQTPPPPRAPLRSRATNVNTTPESRSNPAEEAVPETSAAGSFRQDTLVGSSDDERATKAAESGAEAGVEGPSEAGGVYRRTRSRAPTPGPSARPRSGVRFYTLPAGSRTPLPSSSSHRIASRPFNHYPTPPRSRAQALRREPAFYHKSHYEVGWVPEFGAFDRPPQTVAEATPEWVKDEPVPAFAQTPPPPRAPLPPRASGSTMSESRSNVAEETQPIQAQRVQTQPIQAPTPAPSPPPPSATGSKRARDDEDDKEEKEKGEKRVKRSSLRSSE